MSKEVDKKSEAILTTEVVKVVDIETNDLLANMLDFSRLPYRMKDSAKLWCAVVRDVYQDTYEVATIKDGITKEWFKEQFKDTTEIVAHNGIKFDFLVLKLLGLLDYEVGYLNKPDKLFGREVKITDTLIRSRLDNPDRYGGHGLENWGKLVKEAKTDFRQASIDQGLIEKNAPKAAEFQVFSQLMVDYCIQDTNVTAKVYKTLKKEFEEFKGWHKAEKMENKLADLGIRRETYGFWFDKKLAIENFERLEKLMKDGEDKVNPLLPPKKMNKGQLKEYTPPKEQFKKNGEMNAHMKKFIEKHGMEFVSDRVYKYEGIEFELPIREPIKTHMPASISDLDHVKEYLISLGWNPSEWKIRDLTKDSKKQNLTYDKRLEALDRWLDQTFDNGLYKKHRLEELDLGKTRAVVREKLAAKLKKHFPVRVPTSPLVRIGVEKELCKNLEKLGAKVSFANDFTLYLTHKHRKSSIAGGEVEDIDFDEEYPNKGFLSMYREEDGRIPTPAIEIGASTNRYRHIGVCNVPRASSVFGPEMRSMFGCGEGMVQFGFDFSSLEACEQGHYILMFGGAELAKQLLAKKPNDIHTLNAIKLFGSADFRDITKAFTYAILYGASYKKLKSMLGISDEEALKLYNDFWDSVPSLKALRDAVIAQWKKRGSKYVVGVDGRKIRTRSEHSLLNALFQSAGVINAKYVTVCMFEELEVMGYKCNPFEHEKLDVCGMIEYHDENQLAVNPDLVSYKIFDTEGECKAFVKSWEGSQLSAIAETKNGKFYVTMPNVVSDTILKSIKRSEEETNLNVSLGMEWIVHKTWYGCH